MATTSTDIIPSKGWLLATKDDLPSDVMITSPQPAITGEVVRTVGDSPYSVGQQVTALSKDVIGLLIGNVAYYQIPENQIVFAINAVIPPP